MVVHARGFAFIIYYCVYIIILLYVYYHYCVRICNSPRWLPCKISYIIIISCYRKLCCCARVAASFCRRIPHKDIIIIIFTYNIGCWKTRSNKYAYPTLFIIIISNTQIEPNKTKTFCDIVKAAGAASYWFVRRKWIRSEPVIIIKFIFYIKKNPNTPNT